MIGERRAAVRCGSTAATVHEIADGDPNVLCDLAQQCRRDVVGVVRDRRRSSVRVPILAVRTALAREDESKHEQPRLDFPGFQNRNVSHRQRPEAFLAAVQSCDSELIGSDKRRLEPRLPVLEQHRDDFLEVGAQFLDGRALRMCTRPAWNMADKEP